MSQNVVALVAAGAAGLLMLMSLQVDAKDPPPPPQAVSSQIERGSKAVGDPDGQELLVIEFTDLSLPDFAPAGAEEIPIPESVRNLDGRRVQIRGFMYPPLLDRGNPAFVAVPEVATELRKPSPLGHCETDPERRRLRYAVPVLLSEGETIDYTINRQRNPLIIEGTLRVEGDSVDLELGPCPFVIEGATYLEVQRRDGYDWLWTLWGC